MNFDLSKETSLDAMWMGGTVAYRVTLDGVWIGWVGDGRNWTGWRHGGRRWWVCWRQDGDTAARWSSELEYVSRFEALNALGIRVRSQHPDDTDAEDETYSPCPRGCPKNECYCPDGSEPRWCGHGPGGNCSSCGGCYDCDGCHCGDDW